MTAVTGRLGAAEEYFDAWNRRDPEAILAAFGPGGTYSDPAAGERLEGAAIAAYAAGLFAAFPDLHFAIGDTRLGDDGTVIAEWTMRGTNTGPLLGGPPTGGTVALPGLDVIRLQDGKIASVRGFFDRRTMVEQLGLQALVLPYRVGPATFGTALRLEHADTAVPAAIALTMIECRSDAEVALVREGTRKLLPEIARMRGFLGMTALVTGRRMCTVSAWARPEDTQQLRTGTHGEYTRQVFDGAVGSAGFTAVWLPHRVIRRLRCPACDRWQRIDEGQTSCDCGEKLPATPPAW